MKARVHSIETFGTVDGPGIRYVAFMQGCDFRCRYCHNPDTWNCHGGEEMSLDQILEDVQKYKRYIQGVTLSGGEPLLQLEFVIELFTRLKNMGFDTCVDTSGQVFDNNDEKIKKDIDKMFKVCDYILLDIKHIDDDKHKWLTGKSNKCVLDFAKYADSKKKTLWLRYVLVPGVNDDEDSLRKWKAFADSLKNVEKIELLPYHKMAITKYEKLGIKYTLTDTNEPTKEQIDFAKKILEIKGEE